MRTNTLLVALAGLLACTAPGRASPPFQVALADGSGWVSPGELNDRPSVFLFWDSRCPPCIVELANIAMLQRQFPEALFVAVSLSATGESRRMLSRVNLPGTVLRAHAPQNPKGLLAILGNASGALPFTVAFDPTGQRCASISGALSPSRMATAHSRCGKNVEISHAKTNSQAQGNRND